MPKQVQSMDAPPHNLGSAANALVHHVTPPEGLSMPHPVRAKSNPRWGIHASYYSGTSIPLSSVSAFAMTGWTWSATEFKRHPH